MIQAPLRSLVDPTRDLPIPTSGNYVRRHNDRYPCTAAARLRIEEAVHEVQFLNISHGGGCVRAPNDVKPQIGAKGQVIARTESGLCGDNIIVVHTQPQADGTVIGFRLSESP